jgi:HlyD family secretion protein
MARTKFKLNWVVFMLVVFAVAVLGWWYIRRRNGETPTYQIAPVSREDLIQFVTATGQINPITNAQVGSQISGTILKLYADFNSTVTGGQLVAEIDPAIYKANVDSAEGDLASAKAALELARINEAREKQLLDAKLVPPSDYDQTVATLHQAEATVTMKEAAVETGRVNLHYCKIYSPEDGTVISRNVDVGQTVAASLSAPVLFQIANDMKTMQIDAAVAEADIGNVAPKETVDFSVDAFPYRTFHGTVSQIRNSYSNVQNVVTYDTVIAVDNKDLKLRPGMTANVSIIITRRENALKIPNAALRFRPLDAPPTAKGPPSPSGAPGGQKGEGHKQGERQFSRTIYVLPAGSNKPQPVQIKIGISDGTSTEVVDGLKDGDQVVTGVLVTQASSAQSANPFTGGRRF